MDTNKITEEQLREFFSNTTLEEIVNFTEIVLEEADLTKKEKEFARLALDAYKNERKILENIGLFIYSIKMILQLNPNEETIRKVIKALGDKEDEIDRYLK